MSLFDLLKKDHREAVALLKKIENSPLADERRDLFTQLKPALTAHSRAEEEAVYEVVKNRDKTHTRILENYEEHHLIDDLLEKLSSSSPADETWVARLTVMRELLEHHIVNEEEVLFFRIRALCNREQMNEMAENFQFAKDERRKAS